MSASNDDTHYDLIIVGSGLGALSTASIMAQLYNKRVLVLERHYVIGGFTHVFKRPDKSASAGNKSKYEWDVGVHYIGGMHKGTMERSLFDFITAGRLKWNRMPDPFEKFHYPGFTFDLYGDSKKYKDDLIKTFPDEQAAIVEFLDDIKSVGKWAQRGFTAANLPQPFRFFMRCYLRATQSQALSTTEEYLNRKFKDEKLKALIASQWGTYGLPPSQSPFFMHAGIIQHFMKGGYYPEGGASEIADDVMPLVEAKGGNFLINHEVREILLENGRAVGVEAVHKKGGKEISKKFYAPAIVSDAGAYNTFAKLLPAEIGGDVAKDLKPFLAESTGATVYLGLKESARTLGFQGENHWIYESFDHEANADGACVLEGNPKFCYLSFPSLKNNEASTHTAEILAFVNYDDFTGWADQKWKKRDKDYDALKDTIAKGLIDMVERRHPGFADLVEYVEVSTPLTVEHFTDHPKGAIYGLIATPERFKRFHFSARTRVPNLYLTGADAFMIGVTPALLSGLLTAGALNGPLGFFKVVKKLQEKGKSRPPAGTSKPTQPQNA